MSKESIVYVLALFVGLCAGTISFFMPFFPYGVDSASYLEQARSFMSRGVFEVTPFFPEEEVDIVSVPDKLFPPGYPLLIAISSILLHLPVELIAPLLSLVALILLPAVIVLSFHRILGLWPPLWIGILVAMNPAAIRYGYYAYSDTLSLVLVIYSVNWMLKADNNSATWFWLGLLTGFSYLLRNANLGLLLSIYLYLLWRFIVKPDNRKAKIRNGLVLLSANALVIVPWLIRNYFVFGKLQPYWMPPSTVSLGENIHAFLKAQLDTIFALSDLDAFLTGTPWGNVLLLMLVAMLAHGVMLTWQRWQKSEQQTFFISVGYATIGAAMVIAGRTKYQWGSLIDARYALPYSCFILVAVVIIFKNTTLKINTRYLGLGLAITVLIFCAWELPKLFEYNQYEQKKLLAAKEIKENQGVVCSNLDGRFAVSNQSILYRILCAAPVRVIYFEPQQEFIEKSLPGWAELGEKKGIVVSVFPFKDDQETDLPLKQEVVIKLNVVGWHVERNEKENLIISRKASSSLKSLLQ